MVNVLYHGSSKQNLKFLEPFESGHKKSFVYAVSEEAFATIFINRPGGSLVASWGRLEDGIPYFCERKEGIFEKNYRDRVGSIYIVDKSLFKQKKNLWKEEFISEQKIKPLKEIKVKDLKKHLLRLGLEGKVKIILFKDRKKYFPKIDEKLAETAKKLIEKYGSEKILPAIKKHQPELLDKIIKTQRNPEDFPDFPEVGLRGRGKCGIIKLS